MHLQKEKSLLNNKMKKTNRYISVIGLEIHVQLITKSKAYSSDENIYGAIPNTKTSPISLGYPGTLPKSNKKVIDFAIKLGLSVNASIRKKNRYARKNYFYADLPKGYQITQDKTPVCNGGYIIIEGVDGKEKKIQLTRIHMEEDAGKSIHDLDPFNTLIDLNRAGVPLLEIVSEPEIRNSEEACQFINEIRKLVEYLEICNGNMEEGSLRCDANISVMKKGSKKFGSRVEVKNMNSVSNVKKAIDFEINRQIKRLEESDVVSQETRSFDAEKGVTFSMRSKEKANDYRYFPEPDLQPFVITQKHIQKIKKDLPLLPREILKIFTNKYRLSKYVSSILIEEKKVAFYFLDLCSFTNNFKLAANFMIGSVKSHLNETAKEITEFNISPERLSGLIQLVDENKVSNSIANQKIFPEMTRSDFSAEEIAINNNLLQESSEVSLSSYVQQSLEKYPEKIQEYKLGKKGIIDLFMGEVMRLSKGKADPKITRDLLQIELKK